MKILVYQPRASYFLGGGEVYPLQTIKFFCKDGHDVTLLTTKAKFLKESDYFKEFKKDTPNLKIEYLELDDNFKSIYDIPAGVDWTRWDRESLWVSRLAYQYMDSHNFDIIAIHNVIDTLAVPFGKKHILQLHGAPSEINYICQLVLEREDKLIAVSKNVAEKWIKLGASPNMSIVTNAIDENMFYPLNDVDRDIDLLFVGRLIPIKGVQTILKSLSILKKDYNMEPNFSIIGQGPYREELEKLVKKLKLEKQVTFKGLVSQEDLIRFYQTAKLAVLPSYDKEGIMSTLLEAASCMTPSITTRGTSMEEFALDDKNALLVNPDDEKDLAEKIYKMLTDKELSKRIANNAYVAVQEQYTWQAKARQLVDVYKEV